MMESTSQYWLIRWWMRDVSSSLCGCRGDELGITKLHAQEQPVALKIVVKRDGGYNYSSTDLTSTWYCLDVENIEWNIYVTDVGQWQHFDMLFKAYKCIVTVDAIFRVTSPSVSEFVILKETAFTVYSKARRVSFSSHTAKPVSTKVCSKSVKMLVQFETPAGFALFKVLNKGKLFEVQDLSLDFSTADAARKVAKLKAFSKFENNSSGLIDDSHDIKTSNNTNILGSLTLGIIKVSKGTQEVQNQDMAKLVGIRLKLMFKLCNLMKQRNSVKWLLTFIEQMVQHH
ncbi:hypothetical protein KIW84_032838 [Lathyrus oleraceus]|uniref:Uncharacterized protein n=1 Tax=Pisum sativum TaxID=3888 RepID=A0A9D5AZ76_PEA|nr:hypothetical protein KIW84_032838 [Pisum sativum]